MLETIPKEKLWVNPDCGLKTRGNEETVPSLANLVKAAKDVRKSLRVVKQPDRDTAMGLSFCMIPLPTDRLRHCKAGWADEWEHL